MEGFVWALVILGAIRLGRQQAEDTFLDFDTIRVSQVRLLACTRYKGLTPAMKQTSAQTDLVAQPSNCLAEQSYAASLSYQCKLRILVLLVHVMAVTYNTWCSVSAS